MPGSGVIGDLRTVPFCHKCGEVTSFTFSSGGPPVIATRGMRSQGNDRTGLSTCMRCRRRKSDELPQGEEGSQNRPMSADLRVNNACNSGFAICVHRPLLTLDAFPVQFREIIVRHSCNVIANHAVSWFFL